MGQKNINIKSKKLNQKSFRSAFTIVELLVVIVVIGILATIVMVSYAGITEKAKAVSLQTDLTTAAKILDMDRTNSSDNTYPPTLEQANNGNGLNPSSGNSFDYTYNPTTNTYTLTATNGNLEYYITSDNPTPTLVGGGGESSGPVSFVKAWGGDNYDYTGSITRTVDGGFAIVGETFSFGLGGTDMLIAKYTSDGTLLWDKTWGGAAYDWGYSIIQTSDGGLAVVGSTESFGAGDRDMSIIKYTSDGTLAWNKTWGGTGWDEGRFITQTSDGGLAVVGFTTSFGAGDYDIFIAKYSSDGALLWDKTWGGAGDDEGYSITQTNDGGLAVAGSTRSFGNGGYDMFIAKYSSDGTLLWDKTSGVTGYDTGYSIIQTSDGGLAVTGETESFVTESYDMFIAKYNSDGILLWNKTWGGANHESGQALIQTNDGGLVVTGETRSFGAGSYDMFIAKYNSDGILLWNKTWGGADHESGQSITQINDGSLVVIGEMDNIDTWSFDIFVAKYLPDGSISGCVSPMCQDPSATEINPTATEINPTATETDPIATETDPTATETDPNAIIAWILPIPVPSIVFSSQELYVAYPGEDQTVCKQWSAVGENKIKGFFVNHETEDSCDYFTVSADNTEVYNSSGNKTNHFVDISDNPATTLEACMTADGSVQEGFGGEVTGVMY